MAKEPQKCEWPHVIAKVYWARRMGFTDVLSKLTDAALRPMTADEIRPFTMLALPEDIGARDVVVAFDMEAGAAHDWLSPFAIGLVVIDKESGAMLGAYRVVHRSPHLERFRAGVFDEKDRTEKWWSWPEQADAIACLYEMSVPRAFQDIHRVWVTVMSRVKAGAKVVTDAAAFDAVCLNNVAVACGSEMLLATDRIVDATSTYSSVDEVPWDPPGPGPKWARGPIAMIELFMAADTKGAHDPLFDAARAAVWWLKTQPEKNQ